MAATNDKLSREFRKYVLANLRQATGWQAWYEANGFRGKTNNIPTKDLNRALVELGLDKRKLWVEFNTNAGGVNAAIIASAHIEGEGEDTEDVLDEIVGAPNADPTVLGGATSRAFRGAVADHIEHTYEGRSPREIIEEALAPLGVYMTAHLQSELPKALDAIAQAAVQGPRVETRETVRTVRVADVSMNNAPPVVNVTGTRTVRELFGFKKREAGTRPFAHALDNVLVETCDYFDSPPIDVDYMWSPEMAVMLSMCAQGDMNLWLAGHAGTGKTEGVRQFAALTGRPFIRIPIDRTTEPADLIGQRVPSKEGGVEWRDGALTRAFRTSHAVVLIDEPTLLRSGTLAFLQTCLDTRNLHLPTGETVMCADHVLFVACDNTLGVGDETGRYVDTSPVNAAFLDRFSFRVGVDYLDANDETHMVARRAKLDPSAVAPMVEYAGLTREKARGGSLGMGLTPRRLIAWARAVAMGVSSARAWEQCVVNGAAPEDADTLRMLEGQTLRSQHATIDAIARGTPLPQPSPSPSPAGEAFPDDANDVAPQA